jgi:hypothetical protein
MPRCLFFPGIILPYKREQYFAEGGSDKHLSDVRNMLAIMKDDLDIRFIELQAARLGLVDVWQQVNEVEKRV